MAERYRNAGMLVGYRAKEQRGRFLLIVRADRATRGKLVGPQPMLD